MPRRCRSASKRCRDHHPPRRHLAQHLPGNGLLQLLRQYHGRYQVAIGGPIVGFIAQQWGARYSVGVGAVAALGAGIYGWLRADASSGARPEPVPSRPEAAKFTVIARSDGAAAPAAPVAAPVLAELPTRKPAAVSRAR